jgi:CDP-alcohol phosphatidyltransferase
VTSESFAFVILADESAMWRIAGLRQLDRLALALNELAATISPQAPLGAVIFWHPDIPSNRRWLPRHSGIHRLRLSESLRLLREGAHMLDTHLFVQPGGLWEVSPGTAVLALDRDIDNSVDFWSALQRQCQTSLRAQQPAAGAAPGNWRYLETGTGIPDCEIDLLQRSGKSQDGIVSRFINRPISRRVTRLLLRYEIEPTTWTLWICLLPVLAFFFLVVGSYAGIVVGAAMFQLYSILDGCDGEIARAKYLQSERGARIDDFCDMLGSVLFVVGLGFGLLRSRASIYALEGLVCAGVIVTNEWFLRRNKGVNQPASDPLMKTLYPRHRRLIAQLPLSATSRKWLEWIIPLTKRDVAIFFFLFLAVIGQPQWILHLWLAVSGATLILSARSVLHQREMSDAAELK